MAKTEDHNFSYRRPLMNKTEKGVSHIGTLQWDQELLCPRCCIIAKNDRRDCFFCNGTGRVNHARYSWYSRIKKIIPRILEDSSVLSDLFADDVKKLMVQYSYIEPKEE